MKLSTLLIFMVFNLVLKSQEIQNLDFSPNVDFLVLPDGQYFGEVSGIAINSKDEIYVFHRGERPLLKFDKDGSFIKSIGEGLFQNAHGLRIDKYDNIWTTDLNTHLVLKFNSEGKLLLILGKMNWKGDFVFTNEKFSLFNKPSDIAFDSNDNIYVTDGYGNSRVVKLNSDGERILTWGSKGDSIGQFNLPHTIAIDDNDHIYVGDRENQRIQIFDTNGNLIKVWDHVGYPYGLLWTGDKFYMADARVERIIELSKDGKIIGTYGRAGKKPGEFGWAHMLDQDSKGNLYIAEVLNWRVQKLERK